MPGSLSPRVATVAAPFQPRRGRLTLNVTEKCTIFGDIIYCYTHLYENHAIMFWEFFDPASHRVAPAGFGGRRVESAIVATSAVGYWYFITPPA